MFAQTVLLGPRFDLHQGIHNSMVGDPPAGICYVPRSGRHHFAFEEDRVGDGAALAPFRYPHYGELIDFGPGPQVVHSARWPVLNRRCWVADTDDFGYPYVLGRHSMSRAFEDPRAAWSDALLECARMRAANMLFAFAHPSCLAVLFRTHYAVEGARAWVRRLDLEAEARAFFDKVRVVYPAQRAMLPGLVEGKWSTSARLKVLFVGKDYEAKNGRLALRLFRRLADEFPDVRFSYVGVVPAGEASLAEGIDFRGTLPRPEVLRLFKESHILFHPAREESFGMVFVEAAAHGLAVIASQGEGTQHLQELVGEHEALLVPCGAWDEEAESRFATGLRELLTNPERARQMALALYAQSREGKFSLSQRNTSLRGVYRQGLQGGGSAGVSLNDLPYWNGFRPLRLESDQISLAVKTYFDQEGIQKSNFYRSLVD